MKRTIFHLYWVQLNKPSDYFLAQVAEKIYQLLKKFQFCPKPWQGKAVEVSISLTYDTKKMQKSCWIFSANPTVTKKAQGKNI